MRHRLTAILSAALLLGVVACGGSDGGDDAVALSYEQYFASFSYDYEPAKDLADLAARSVVVVEAILVDVIDGPVFGSSATDPAASRFAVFVFESAATAQPLAVRLPRPNTSDIAAIRGAMPIGERAVLYLIEVPPIPDSEKARWHGVDGTKQWEPTTPQGFVLGRRTPDGPHVADVPIDVDRGGLADAPDADSDVSDWLPPGGQIVPEGIGATEAATG